jgi:ADP-ribose pyrophosphatase YjhB (NUDIX family)
MADSRVRLGAFAVIPDVGSRVLVCHRRDVDVWDLPGGGVNAGEPPWEAVVREVGEETGLAVAVERLTGTYAKPSRGELVLVFRCGITGGELRLTEEADEHVWVDVEQLPVNMNPNQKQRVWDAVNGAPCPALRVQPGYSASRPEVWLPG